MTATNGSGRSDRTGAPSRDPGAAALARRTVVVTLVVLLLVVGAVLLWKGVHVLLQAFAGVLFAVFLTALSDWLSSKTRLSYHLSLVVVFLGLVLLTGGLGWLLASRLAAQVGELSVKLPESFAQLRAYLAESSWGRLLLHQVPKDPKALGQVDDFSRVTGLVSGVASFLVSVVVILFVGIFGAAEPRLYRSGLLHLVPAAHRPRTGEALDAVLFNLRWWLVGQVFLMFVIGATTAVCLAGLGIPLALTLGVIAGVLELVPYVGPWLSAVPALLMALLVSPWHVVAVAGLYIGLHILEGYVLLPLIQRRSVHMSPALTLVSQVLLGELLGIMGLVVAAPLTVTVVVLLKMLYVEDTLGDQAVDVPGEPGNEEKPVVSRH